MSEERNMYQESPYQQMGQTSPMHSQCQRLMYFHVIIKLNDGNTVDGILESVENDQISMLVPEEVMGQEDDGADERQFGYGYGGRPRRRFRRFVRRFLPFAALAALTPYPYYYPYPYYPYPYPYY
jgi:small nuclear ribonucleoprotein (snRNP)-like protein